MAIKAVLFDLDGVLVDSFMMWHSVLNDALNDLNKPPIDRETYRKEVWTGLHFAESIPALTGVPFDEIIKRANPRLPAYIKELKPQLGAKEMIIELRDLVKLGVVTNAPRGYTMALLSLFDFRFPAIMTFDDVKMAKPSGEMVTKACEMLGVRPEETLVVGDTIVDMMSGNAAGARTAGFCNGGEFLINNLSEVVAIVRGENIGPL